VTQGLITLAAAEGYPESVRRLDRFLGDHSITPLLRLDHAAAAAAYGLSLRPLLLVVFGDPRVGSRLMEENPAAGIDLPLKLLIWQTAIDGVRVGYNDPAWIATRHGLRQSHSSEQTMAALLRKMAHAVAGAQVSC